MTLVISNFLWNASSIPLEKLKEPIGSEESNNWKINIFSL
ncbi:hypothetical protein Mcup_0916 [Metallosphaera cuprina Ar-4]|uniref:Uncharacterized protein n=1 Tax=Metallosphaera cuprina (strain Ar-4) TaxID=1006006 RepID=F4G2H3_METCR|nr:hypothetical protein Mcup_0916 [Metallosphaera cuprina Ar-4]